jgi:hypothetical protein
MKFIAPFCCLFILSPSFSQTNNNQEKIKNYIQNYFLYDRENIHVQFNKNSYVNNEDLAFKGYVYSKNNNTLNNNTTNVQLVIYDEQQKIVQKQLLYANAGTFAGGIHLNDTLKSGLYYFRFYTNWMNNFKEDDSFTQTIEIIDKNEPYYFKSNAPNWKTAKVSFFPEGGTIIDGIINTVGIKITDCNQKGIEVNGITILDSKSNEISHCATNKMGNGLFYFVPKLNEKYTLKINTKEVSLSQPLPNIQETGIILTYNNKLEGNKIAVAIRTNEKGITMYRDKNFTLLIQQDGNSIQKEIAFKNNETESLFVFDKKYLSNGVNSIRLIDENLNEVCERLIYNYSSNKAVTTLEAKAMAKDSIQLSGKTDAKQANLSISILPSQNTCINDKRSILGTFYLNAYLQTPEINNYSYYDLENNNRIQDMDLLLLNQNHSKYLWKNITSEPPKITYPFDKGVTISGKVENETNSNTKFKMSLISLKDNFFDETAIDQNNEFKFEHFYAKDSTVFLLQMINKKNNTIKTKIEARVTRNEMPFSFPLKTRETNCPTEKTEEKSMVFTNPKPEDNTIPLDEVTIKNKYKKEVLTHKKDMSINASAYKIGDTDFGNVLDFIGMHGYRTGVDPEENNVYIQSYRTNFTGNATSPPSVYIDDDLVFDLNLLFDISLQDVDEIYIDASGSSDSSMRNYGTIKIFLKPNRIKNDYFNAKYTSLIVTKGFAKNIDFKNTAFETQQEWNTFGTLNWSPNIILKENSTFEVKLPRKHQEEIQILIEGISNDGQLISEIRTIPVLN